MAELNAADNSVNSTNVNYAKIASKQILLSSHSLVTSITGLLSKLYFYSFLLYYCKYEIRKKKVAKAVKCRVQID